MNMIYLHRSNALVPPTWHAVLPDCYTTKTQNKGNVSPHMIYSNNISQCHSAALRLEQKTQLSIHFFLLCSKISLHVS